MKYLKYILFIILGALGLYLLLCLVSPKNLDLTESTEIEAPPLFIYNLVNNLENGELWAAWSQNDTAMMTTYNNVKEGVGAKSDWISEKEGNGTQQIIESTKPTFVRSQLNFEGVEGNSYASFLLNPRGKSTEVTWTFEGDRPLPFLVRGAFLLMGMKKQLKQSYRSGLKNLKSLAEERANKGIYYGYKIREEMLAERHFIMRRDIVKIQNMQQFYASNLGALFTLVQRAKINMDGMPCGLFFNLDNQNQSADMAAAIPVESSVAIEGATSYTLAPKNAIVTDHFGDYSLLSRAHEAVEAFMKDRNFLFDPPFIEEYVTDPGTVQDPNKIQTQLTFYFTE